MTQALIFDALRTPRGKGKANGALHSVKPVNLVAGLLTALQQRTALDTSQVDDVVLGCVTPIGDQGLRHRQDRGPGGGLGRQRGGRADQPFLRFGAGGGEPRAR